MKHIITTLILSLSFSMFLISNVTALSYSSNNTVAYNPFSGVCSTQGQGNTSSSSICANTSTGNKASDDPVIEKILNAVKLIDTVIGIAAVIMIVIGGIRFVLSGGEPANVAAARNTIIYAVVGLVVAVVAQLVLLLVINNIK